MQAAVGAANRTRTVLRQSLLGLVYRLGAVAASFAMMPLMLQQLGSQAMGAWLVLLSVFQWVTFFDLGVAAGARNEIARAVANHDANHARRAIATGWYYTVLITMSLAVLLAAVLFFTPASSWLRVNAFGGVDTGVALWVVIIGSCVSFALSYIQTVFAAYQRASAMSVFSMLANVGFLALLFLVHPEPNSGLARMSILYLVAMLSANLWLVFRFFYLYPEATPKLSNVDHGMRSRIMGFGVRLFVIQLAAMVIFTTARLMVSAFVGPAEVVIYDAGFKLFSVITMVHTLVMSTMWSSFTDAYEQDDWLWIKTSLKRLTQFMLPLALSCVILAFLSPWLISVWLGSEQVGTPGLYGWFALVVILSCWSNVFAYFLNGIGDVAIQFYSALTAALVNIPASYFFAVHMNMGVSGVLVGTVCSVAIFSVLGPWQVIKLIKHRSEK
jgi:O-antigen/teichoic acid export membrane protein